MLLIGLVFEPHSKSFTHWIQTKNEEELAGLKEWKESKGFREGESLWKMVVWRLGRGESDSLFFCLAPRDQLSTKWMKSCLMDTKCKTPSYSIMSALR